MTSPLHSQSNTTIMQRYGTSYYLATLFFPKNISQETMQLYKFVRIPDQIVDGEVQDWPVLATTNLSEHYLAAWKQLRAMWKKRESVYTRNDYSDEEWGLSAKLFHDKKIPFSYSRDFFDAMLMDTDTHRYQTYEQLQQYMYGSASVVGLMMCHITGFEKEAIPYATLLGEAMQLSNFLRDIGEDYELLGRIYLPEQDLKRFDLTHNDIIYYCESKRIDERFVHFMQEYITLNRKQYAQALEWLQYLPKKTRKGVYLAAIIYEGILDRIEKNNYNVFARSCRTTKRDKTKLLVRWLRTFSL